MVEKSILHFALFRSFYLTFFPRQHKGVNVVWGRGMYMVLVGKPEGKRPLRGPRYRWEDNIKMDLQEVGCGGMDWIKLAQDRARWQELVNVVTNLRAP